MIDHWSLPKQADRIKTLLIGAVVLKISRENFHALFETHKERCPNNETMEQAFAPIFVSLKISTLLRARTGGIFSNPLQLVSGEIDLFTRVGGISLRLLKSITVKKRECNEECVGKKSNRWN